MRAKARLWIGGASFVLALVALSIHQYGHAGIDLLLSAFFTLVPAEHA